jgi:hypothetical protein
MAQRIVRSASEGITGAQLLWEADEGMVPAEGFLGDPNEAGLAAWSSSSTAGDQSRQKFLKRVGDSSV